MAKRLRDSGQWFDRHGGMTRANGDVFRDQILSRGRTQEPAVLFEKFYGGRRRSSRCSNTAGFPSRGSSAATTAPG